MADSPNNSNNSGNTEDDEDKKKKKPSRSDSYDTIVDSIAGAAGAFTNAFTSAGQAVSGTASQIATGAGSVVSDMGGAISGAVSAVGGAVSSLSSSLGPIGAVVGSVTSAVATVTGAVVNVASSAATAAVAVGGAILGTVTTLATAAVSVVASVISTVSSVVTSFTGLMSGASAGLGALASVAGAVTSVIAGVANVIGTIAGALSSVVSGLVSAATAVVGALTSAFKSISEALGNLAGIAGQALGGLASAIQSSVDALTSFANDVTSINLHTGMSLPDAANLTNDMRSVGLSSGDTSKIFSASQNRPDMFNARSSSLGLARLDAPNFIVDESRKYHDIQAKSGTTVANTYLKAQVGEQNFEKMLSVVAKDPNKLQSNISYGRQVQGQLGVGTSQIKSASEDLPLLMERVSTFVDTLKIKFAAELLPALEGAFNVISGVLASNAGNISNVIQTATHAIFVDGPDLAANAANTVIDWGSNIADMFLDVAQAAITFVQGFGSKNGVLFSILMAAAKFIDTLILIVNRVKGVLKNGGPPIKFSAEKAVLKGADGVAKWDFNKGIQGIKSIRSTKENIAEGTHNLVNDTHARFGTAEDRDRTMRQAQLDVQKEQLSVQKQHLDVAKSQGGGSHSASQVLGRIGAYIAEDAYRLTSR